jgi:hypothetical protein
MRALSRSLLVITATMIPSLARGQASTPAASAPTRQQSEAEVLAVVNRLWEAMRTNDSVKARSVFDSTAQMARIVDRNGTRTVRWSKADGFIKSVGSAKVAWIERMVSPEVRVDGNLASVWTWYDFSLGGGKVLHCGYDSIELARTTDGWKIIYLADTQQTTGCEKPPTSH